MLRSFLLFVCQWMAFAVAVSVTREQIVMERQIPRHDFVRGKRSNPTISHEVVIAIPKLNLDQLETEALARASPESPNYQNWLSYDEVTTLVQNLQAFEAVQSWLIEEDIAINWVSPRKDYIRAVSTISRWEMLLNTKFYEHADLSRTKGQKDGSVVHRAIEYSVPKPLKSHIFAIFNTVQTPPRFSPKYYVREHETIGQAPFRSDILILPEEASKYLRSRTANTDQVSTEGGVTHAGYVTVAFLNQYYGISTNNGSSSYAQSVFETSTEFFAPTDLTLFQQHFQLHVQAAVSIGNHNTTSCPVTATNMKSCFEGNLDIQYIMGVSQVTSSIFWWVPGDVYDPFVLWITTVAGETNPPRSNSISWGANEPEESASILTTFNNEAMQLAAMGVSIFASSGDNGVANLNSQRTCQCSTNSGSSTLRWAVSTSWTGAGYFPNFPATSPYVTAAGATQGPEVHTQEIACQSQKGGVITTGGGFSTYFSTPSWQLKTINRYFQQLPSNKMPTSGYNRNGRGIPDVSLIGVKYLVAIGGVFQSVYGTSCTAPVLAAYVSLVNAERERRGKSTLGWLNPTLYAVGYNQSINVPTTGGAQFNDVVVGNNSCCASGDPSQAVCCSSGFIATAGWDPVTGWGSVNFTEFATMFGTSFVGNGTSNNGGGGGGGGGGGSAGSQGSSSGSSGLSTAATAAVAVVVVLLGVAIGIALVWFRALLCGCAPTSAGAKEETSADRVSADASAKASAHQEMSPVKRKAPEINRDTSRDEQQPSTPPPSRRNPPAAEMAPRPPPRSTPPRPMAPSGSQSAPQAPLVPPKPPGAAPSWVQTMRANEQPPPPSAAAAPAQVPQSSRPAPNASSALPSAPSSNSGESSEVPPANGTAEVGFEVFEEEKTRINMSNPMAAAKNRSKRPDTSTSSTTDRNSMNRVEMLQRGLSLDRGSSGGGGVPMTGRGVGPRPPPKPLRPRPAPDGK